MLSPELQPGKISNIADRNVVITALPNMTSKTVTDLYYPHDTPSSLRHTAVSLSHTYSGLHLGSLHSTASFSTRTRPLTVTTPSGQLRLFSSQTFSRINTPTISSRLFFLITRLWRRNRVPKRRNIKFKTRGTTEKKEIQHSEHGESLKSRVIAHSKFK